VVLELESHAELPGGEQYDNRYCYVVTVVDGALHHVREYSDTAYGDRALTPEVQELFAAAAAAATEDDGDDGDDDP